jgi:uncharacterized protein YybS (DUF2232 family)
MTRSLVESALLAALGSVLVLVGYYVPLLGPIAVFLWPLPSALAVLRHGTRWGFLSSIVTGLSLLLFMDWLTALSVWVLFALTGVTFGYAVSKEYSPVATIFITSGAFLVGLLMSFLSVYFVAGFTPAKLIDDYLKAMQAATEMNKKIFGPNAVLEQFSNLEQVKEQLIRLLPGAILVSAVFQSYMNFEVARRVLSKLGQKVEPLPPFSRWIFPEYVAHGAFVSYLAVALEPYHKISILMGLGENALFMFSLILFAQAASVLSYFMKRARVPGILTGLTLFYLFVTPGLNTLAMLFGMIDVLFDFRHLRYGWVDEI